MLNDSLEADCGCGSIYELLPVEREDTDHVPFCWGGEVPPPFLENLRGIHFHVSWLSVRRTCPDERLENSVEYPCMSPGVHGVLFEKLLSYSTGRLARLLAAVKRYWQVDTKQSGWRLHRIHYDIVSLAKFGNQVCVLWWIWPSIANCLWLMTAQVICRESSSIHSQLH